MTEGQHPARSWGLSTDRPKEPETPRAERALRTAPVRKEPPRPHESKDLVPSART